MTDDPAYLRRSTSPRPGRIVLLGASGTIGRAVLRALLADGYTVVCPVRKALKPSVEHSRLHCVIGDFESVAFWKEIMGEAEAVISCVASRSGTPQDAWAVDYGVNAAVLTAAKKHGIARFVLLSAICVQKPTLAFQKAKLAFEAELKASRLRYTIVRPTAFFKSLSGQIDRLRAGKPFLVFSDGQLTSCKPISDEDLSRFIVNCLSNPACDDRILPVGGPGPALTPLEQGRLLAKALGVPFRTKRVPVALFDGIIAMLGVTGWLSRRAKAKAELARIGRYYATESMLVWDTERQRYDAEATPEFGEDRLEDFYAKLAAGEVELQRGEHAVF